MLRPGEADVCRTCGAIDRTARVLVAFVKLVVRQHEREPGHERGVWTRCRHLDCVQARLVVETVERKSG